jgi:hypothetical protein
MDAGARRGGIEGPHREDTMTDEKGARNAAVAMLAGLLATFPACSNPPIRPLPTVPAVQTESGSQCVQGCQRLYNDCMRLTLRVVPGAFSPVTEYDAAGLDACRENLGGCYGTCR